MNEKNREISPLHGGRNLVKRAVLGFVCCATLFTTSLGRAQSGVADPAVVAPLLGLKILNEKVPPGGMLQLKLSVTEPAPILRGNQRMKFASAFLGPARGIHLFSPAGDVSGVAVLGTGDAQVYFSSPLTSFGTSLDYPVLTIAMPVLATATPGKKVTLALDGVNSSWLDPASNPYPVELKSGVLTVGGTLSISDVAPGAGIVPAGTPIVINGVGFPADAIVRVDHAVVSSFQFVSPTQIRITLNSATDMESRRIRIKNPSTNETVTYYSYQRTTAVGVSTHALVASSYPLFSRATWTLAYFKPVASGTAFSGLALQNTTTASVTVKLELLNNKGARLATKSIALPAASRMVRDTKEFFAKAVTGTEIRVTSPVAIQVLGLLGDDASGIVLPVTPSTTP
jgi:hypothetical protein